MNDSFFSGSPFLLTASKITAGLWAGRPAVKSKVDRLCRSWSHREDSTLDVVWANFGCGKSHLLRHIEWNVTRPGNGAGAVLPVYMEVPEQRVGFIEWYKRIVGAFPDQLLAKAVVARSRDTTVSSMKRLALVFQNGAAAERAMGRAWIDAGHPQLRELRALTGIDERIDSDARALSALCELIAGLASLGGRCVLLVDEYQRLANLNQNVRSALLAGLRTLFSTCPTGLSLVVAVTSRMEETATALIPEELRTLSGMRPAFQLPEFDVDEAMQFIAERFTFFRPSGYAGGVFGPFSETEIRSILGTVTASGAIALIPRTVLQSVGGLLDWAMERPIGAKLSEAEIRGVLGLQ